MQKFRSLIRLPFLLSAVLLILVAGVAGAAGSGERRFVVSVDSISNFPYKDSGAFNTPVGAAAPGPALPGDAYQWSFNGGPGDRLSLATMFVQSNDWFFAPDELGIPLYDADGRPISGDVTQYVKLWDAGTEGDETPGEGSNQPPRQSGPNTGPADPDDRVRQVLSGDLPAVDELVRVSLLPLGDSRFTVRIDNISGSSDFATPLAPGVGVVHTMPAPLFANGQADRGLGLEALAEDGDPSGLAAVLAAGTGVNTPLAPVAYTVHTEAGALFSPGQASSAGLESLAEDGNPAALVAGLGGSNSGAAAVPHGAGAPGPIFPPAGNYSFEITAMPGDRLSLATMFVQSNDWFFALNNVPLFDDDGQAIEGNLTGAANLWEAGTEVNQAPGFGSNQAPRQAGPNTGPSQGGLVQQVDDPAFSNPADFIHITITPLD